MIVRTRGRALLRTGLVALALAAIAPRAAEATIVERVVAVIGEQAIFQSELRHRARPILAQIAERVPPGPQRSAVESEMFKELLQQMVDERLVQVAADRSQKKVSSDEIDAGMRNIAGSQGLTVDELMSAAVQSGLTVQELREQVQRQLLEQKMLSLRVMPRVRISTEDVRVGYSRLLRDERKKLGYRLQWIVLHVPPDSSAEARQQRRELADSLVAAARAGADFADLAKRFSDDSGTRPKGGDLGPVKPGALAQSIDDVAMALDVGEISAPFTFGQDFVIVRVSERDQSALPPLADAHDRVASEVFTERLQKARRQWLDELKRSVHVDVRLLPPPGVSCPRARWPATRPAGAPRRRLLAWRRDLRRSETRRR
jgi:peptidyl-prolyl cis-trans isomerase SurA